MTLKDRLDRILMAAKSESLDRGDSAQQWVEEVEEAVDHLNETLEAAREVVG